MISPALKAGKANAPATSEWLFGRQHCDRTILERLPKVFKAQTRMSEGLPSAGFHCAQGNG